MSDMPRFKSPGEVKAVIVGKAGYPPHTGKQPVDTRHLVQACNLEGCWLPATQVHGLPDQLIHTCDDHSEIVMEWLVRTLL